MRNTDYFLGYERPDGSVGVRNYVALIPSVGCANEVALQISHLIRGTVALTHHQGCLIPPRDLAQVSRVLIGLGKNPNVASCLIVSLGCESVDPDKIADEIARTGKPVEIIKIYEEGGSIKAIAKGAEKAAKMVSEASRLNRKSFDVKELILSTKCGASDTTSGISSNLVVGAVADKIVEKGGTFIFGEVCDIMGGEEILAKRAVNEEVGKQIIDLVRRFNKLGTLLGVDLVGSQLTAGNVAGGLTTVVEKALGANAKSGKKQIKGVLEYGERPKDKGLYVMNTPGHGFENLTGVASAGSQLMLFTTGLGAPEGHPILPVIKVCGNRNTCNRLAAHIDVDVTGVIDGTESIEEAAERLYRMALEVASGRLTKAEILRYDETMEILIYGPVI